MRPAELDIERYALLGDCLEHDPPATILLMIRLYLDESGTGGDSLMTLGAWAIHDDDIPVFARHWRAVLKAFGVREAKATDIIRRRGDFAGWGDRRAEQFEIAVSQVIQRHVMFGVAMSIVVEDYLRVVREVVGTRSVYHQEPYVYLLQSCIERCINWPRLRKRDRFLCVPDAGIPHAGRVKAAFLQLVDKPGPVHASGRVARDWRPVDSLDVCGVQAADLLASGARIGVKAKLRDGTVHSEVRGLHNITKPVIGGFYTERNMRENFEPIASGRVVPHRKEPLAPEDQIVMPRKRRPL